MERNPLTPRKSYLNRTPVEMSQAAKARLVLASKGFIRPEDTRTSKELAVASLNRPVSPASVGLGRRKKTRKARKARRVTRRRL